MIEILKFIDKIFEGGGNPFAPVKVLLQYGAKPVPQTIVLP